MTGTLTGGDFFAKLQAFVAYALGMALVLMVLTLAIALASKVFRDQLVFRSDCNRFTDLHHA